MSTQAAVILGVAIVAGALIVVFGFGSAVEVPAERDLPAGVEAPRAPHSADAPSLQVPGGNDDVGRLMRELAEAKKRIAQLEERGGAAPSEAASAEASAGSAQKRAHVLELVKAYATGTATREQVGELLKLAKDKVLMGRVVADLKAQITDDPDDLAARLQLAEVESARVHGAESITERSMLAGSVREQLTEVLKRDPENWDARYMRAVGISHSQRTPQGRATAIREFESLIAIQESRAAEPRFAETYGQLAQVYMAEKDLAKARAALENGIARFPDAKDLRKQLEALGQ